MKLSDGEKLMLLMLCDIYEKIDVESGMEPEFVRSAILDDQLWALDWKYSGIPFEKSETPAHLSEALDILDMWWAVEQDYQRLEDTDRQELEKSLGCNALPKFDGFDGNNEIEYMVVCRYLIEKLDRYSDFKGRDLNSHRPSLERYRAMVNAFKPMRQHLSRNNLGMEQIRKILRAPRRAQKHSLRDSTITQDLAF